MATAHIQTVTGDWSTGTTWTATITATNGNLLIASIHWNAGNGSNAPGGVSDGTNGSYTAIDSLFASVAGENSGVSTFYVKNITGGALTVTANAGSGNVDRARLVVEEVSGCDTTAPLNVHTIQRLTAPGTGTDAITSGAVTAAAGDYVFGATSLAFTDTLTHGTGFTDGMNATHWAIEYIAAHAGGSQAATFTGSGGGQDYFTAIATFKAAAGGGGGDIQEWRSRSEFQRSQRVIQNAY
jgi:hypothetical protein